MPPVFTVFRVTIGVRFGSYLVSVDVDRAELATHDGLGAGVETRVMSAWFSGKSQA
jgi:hypothetical protein